MFITTSATCVTVSDFPGSNPIGDIAFVGGKTCSIATRSTILNIMKTTDMMPFLVAYLFSKAGLHQFSKIQLKHRQSDLANHTVEFTIK